jgi:predicted nucleic acid-binding protein
MGVIVDSSVFIANERLRKSARQALTELEARFGGQEIAMSIVSVVELAHGVARANSPMRQAKRQEYLDHLIATLQVHPISLSIALAAGRIDGENAAKGIRLALADLLIGVTALDIGYSVLTANVRRFNMVPGLTVVSA